MNEQADQQDVWLGIVQDGDFHLLGPKEEVEGASPAARLTTISMQAAQSPESAEIDLAPYEGRTVMVTGHDGGGWIYDAEVVDEGGPIVTALVLRVFGRMT